MDEPVASRVSWGSMLAVASAYAACYEITLYFSFSHWLLPAGLRLACLLLVPRRFWLALALGESLPAAEHALTHLHQFGIGWTLSAGTPIIVLCMPIVALVQRRHTLFQPLGEFDIGRILALTAACAGVTVGLNYLGLTAALNAAPDKWPEINVTTFSFAYFLGAYLGALALTPALLALRESFQGNTPVDLAALARHPLVRDIVLIVLPVLVAMVCIAPQLDGWQLFACRLLTLVPVVMLTLRRGWHGAALSGLMASIALAETSNETLDVPVIQVQIVLAVVLSGALWIGVPIHRRIQRKKQCAARLLPLA